MKQDLDTPSLVVNIDLMKRNMAAMASFAKDCGVNLRPHAKTHKVPEIAKMQIATGAKGICLQKLGEAETFAAHGLDDIFITNEVVGEHKYGRLAELSGRIHLGVAADDIHVIRSTAEACRQARSQLDVYVDVDVGMHRCGVTPAQSVALAEEISRHDSLVFKGLMGYEGHVGDGKTKAQQRRIAQDAMKKVSEAKRLIERKGLKVEVVSVGSSVSTRMVADHPDVTEVQPGMYLFNDGGLVDKGAATLDDCALTVLTTVMSRPTPERAVIDAGSKAFQWDRGIFPRTRLAGVTVVEFSEEHGWLRLRGSGKSVKVGDRLEFIPQHCCTCVNQHDELVALHGDRVEVTWPIAARGRMT